MISLAYVIRESQDAWNAHLNELRPLWEGKRFEALDKNGIVYAALPQLLAMNLTVDLKLAAKKRLDVSDCASWAVPSAYKPAEIKELNETNAFCEMPPKTTVVILSYLKDIVAEILGCPWRVLNVRSWETVKEAIGGPSSWHTDGGPKDLLKIMLYPNGGGLEVDSGGGTKQRIEGVMWALFYNSLLHHSAIAPVGRVVTEITLAPSREFDLIPKSCGLNGKYPIYPNGDL